MRHRPLLLSLALLALAAAARAQQGDRFVIPLSAPGQPVEVHVGLVYGSISVEPHANANEVVLEARAVDEDDRGNRGESDARRGMRRLPNRSLGLSVEEEGNRVKVSMDGAPRAAVLHLYVPRRASLKLSTVNNGDISVRGIEGDLELQNTNGDVTAVEVAGTVVAHTVNGGVKVVLNRVDAKAAMAFSTLNGDVDVSVPADFRADLRMRSDNGEIYSDFDVQLVADPARVSQGRSGGRYRLEVEREVRGRIGGGGPEVSLRTFNGDILLRKRG